MKTQKKKRCLIILSMTAATLLSGCSTRQQSPYPEVSKYLNNTYAQDFELTEISDGNTVYYKASPKEHPELEFKVIPVGTEYTNKGFDDTYPTVFVQNEAEKLGLSLEPGDTDKELVASIDSYAQIEELSETLAGIATAYAEAGLPAKFTLGTVQNGWNCADIRVELCTPDMEGYEPAVIHIPDSKQIADSRINDKEAIADRIGSGYITYICQNYLGDPLDYLTQDAVTAFYADADGLTVKSGESATEYPHLTVDLHFAELYHLAEAEGWNPQAAQNSFSITANGQTSWFFLEFEDDENERGIIKTTAHIYWAEDETGERLPACDEKGYHPDVIDQKLIEERAGCDLSPGLLLQESAARREKNKEELNGYLSSGNVKSPGSNVEIGNWIVTVTDAAETGKIDSGSMYFEPDPGKSFLRIDMEITNQAAESERFLPTLVTYDELMLQLAVSNGLQYSPVSLLGGGDLTGNALDAGETKSGFIVFQVSENLMETEDTILLLLRMGTETQAIQIKNDTGGQKG